jgi:hypothetical protein
MNSCGEGARKSRRGPSVEYPRPVRMAEWLKSAALLIIGPAKHRGSADFNLDVNIRACARPAPAALAPRAGLVVPDAQESPEIRERRPSFGS